MRTTTRKIALGAALCAALATSLVVVGGALGARGGNSANAKLCQKGGYATLMDSSGHAFADQDGCVSYAAHGGALYTLATLDLEPCADQPFDGICVSTSGAGLKPGSVVTTTLSKNASPVKEEFPIVQGDGTVTSSPIASFALPCVAGNVWSASATGTSADSVTTPTVPGIAVTSNTVERTSACP